MFPNIHLHTPVILLLTCQGRHESSLSGVDLLSELCSLKSMVEGSNQIMSIENAFMSYFLVMLSASTFLAVYIYNMYSHSYMLMEYISQ